MTPAKRKVSEGGKEGARSLPNRNRLYGRQWRKLRIAHLSAHPLCVMCKAQGKVTAADTVDHIRPHKGDASLFFDAGNLQSLCSTHHDATKQSMERTGMARGCAVDGTPLDAQHPWHSHARQGAGGSGHQWGYSIPDGIRRASVPVHLVCGPPGAGKSTFVREHARDSDTVIDVDDIKAALGYPRYSDDPGCVRRTLTERNRMLHALSQQRHGEAWVIVMAPTDAERRQWSKALGNVTVHAIETDADECKRRIMADPQREGQKERLCRVVDSYVEQRERQSEKTMALNESCAAGG